MEDVERIAALEAAVEKILDILLKLQQDVAVIKSNYVTKAELQAALAPIASDVALIKGTFATKVELDLVERRVAVIESNYVTRDYLHKELKRHTLTLMAFVSGINIALFSAGLYAINHLK